MIAIVDYGMGNLRSVSNALRALGVAHEIVTHAVDLERADKIILPGVGGFPEAAKRLREQGLMHAIRARVAAGIPLLGICLGLQLLFDTSDEFGATDGLELIPGVVRRVPHPRLPHIGWNTVHWSKACVLTDGLPDSSFYFLHSFAAVPALAADVLGVTDYGAEVVAAVARERVYGVQFHPEKSDVVGLELLENFVVRG